MSYDLCKKVESVHLDDFKITKVIKADDYILIEAMKECPVYFTFFKHYIVCSGDYGEWVFDCTWDTTKNQIPSSIDYLYSKLSRNAEDKDFNLNQAEIDLKELLNDLRNYYEDDIDTDKLDELDSLFEDFEWDMNDADKYRICSIVDKNLDEIEEIIGEIDCEQRAEFYRIGETVNRYLVVNLAMLNRIRELNVLGGQE